MFIRGVSTEMFLVSLLLHVFIILIDLLVQLILHVLIILIDLLVQLILHVLIILIDLSSTPYEFYTCDSSNTSYLS